MYVFMKNKYKFVCEDTFGPDYTNVIDALFRNFRLETFVKFSIETLPILFNLSQRITEHAQDIYIVGVSAYSFKTMHRLHVRTYPMVYAQHNSLIKKTKRSPRIRAG